MSNFWNNLKFIDCHSHPQDKRYEREGVDVALMLEELQTAGGATIAIGTDYEHSVSAIEVANKHTNVWCTIGVHPADNHAENFDERFFELHDNHKEKIVGVGECGLDYYYFNENTDAGTEKRRQKKLFEDQIAFALEHDLPLVLHGRPTRNSMDAYRDMLSILEETAKSLGHQAHKLRGHAHFFVGNLEIAKRFLNLGFLMSFDGPITYTNEYDEVINFLPLEAIMIETDSPYASPVPYRGQICKPQYVIHVAEKVAKIKSISTEEVLEVTKSNAIRLFNLGVS